MRILIAGLGAIGQRHARNLRALYGDRLELLALRRRHLPHVVTDSLQRIDTRNVETELDVTVFADLGEALAARPEAVFVCTPSSQHLELAQRAAEAGCHLFIEKPLSHTFEGVERLCQTVAAKGLIAMVGCQWRYHPCVRWVREVIQAGTLGTLIEAEIEYGEYLPDWHPYQDYRTSYAARANLGGGVVLTQIHDYDLAWWLFGPAGAVTATGGHLSDSRSTWKTPLTRGWKAAWYPCRFASMATRPPRRVIAITGEAGLVTVDLVAGRISSTPRIASAAAFADYQRNQMFMDEVRHFQACLAGTESPAVTLEDGIEVLRLALAVKESMRTRTEGGDHVKKPLDFSLENRVAIVTGGAGLLGVRHAEAIAAAGGVPVLADIRGADAEARASELAQAFGVPALGLACDITRQESVEALLQTVVERLGRVDILVNNAANNPEVEAPGQNFSRLERFPLEQWDADLAVGLTGAFLCARIIGGALAKQKRGVIINISSEYGIIAPDQRLYRKQELAADEQPVKPVTYSVVKAGLHGLTLYLATYWALSGVRVNTISLGGVESGQHDAFLERATAKIPMGRMAQPHDFQGALVYLCSDAAAFVTGANLVVDGGKTIW